jgi:transposase
LEETAICIVGIPAICIEARQAKAAMGAMPNKTDRNDAAAAERRRTRAN